MIAGDVMPCACTSAAMPSSGAVAVRWSGSVPRRTTATGWSAGRPAAISCSAIAGRFLTPMYSTSVPGNAASASQSRSLSSLPGRSWPVTKATAAAVSRWVTGMPA